MGKSIDWKDLVGSIAPTIATALGGPLAGVATKAISTAVLGKENGGDDEITQAIAAGGTDILAKIKEVERAFEIRMKELDIDLTKIASDDRADARGREEKTKDSTPKILAAVIVLGFFATLAMVSFTVLPAGAQAPVNILLGALTGLLLQVGNYYYGSSKGSSQKNEMMKDLLSKGGA